MASVAAMPTKETRVQEPAATIALEAAAEVKTGMAGIEQHSEWGVLSRIPMRLAAGIPLPRFKVKDLLALEAGQVIASTWLSSEDVPLKVGGVQLSWSEFEVVERRLAVRLTRLA